MRVSNWDQIANDYLASKANSAFEWGVNDCALFAADLVLLITGRDIAAEYRGKYDSQLSAAAALREYGQGTLEATFDALFDVIPIGDACRFDLAYAEGSIGIVIGDEALFVGEQGDFPGLVRIARSSWVKAWRVG